MLFYLSEWLGEAASDPVWQDRLSPLRLFTYISFRSAGAFLTALVVSLAFGPRVIKALIRLKFGQNYEDIATSVGGRSQGSVKLGVPSMGGLLIHLALLSSTLLWAQWNTFILLCIAGTALLAAVGFFDDYMKIKRKDGIGASGHVKIAVQIGVSLLVIAGLMMQPETRSLVVDIYVPFRAEPWKELLLVGASLIFLTVTGSSNAVNLTDGMDGLAIGCMIIVSFIFLIVTYVTGHVVFAEYLRIDYVDGAGELTVLCAALIGAGLGFLWFNSHPAQVFMGDTGSLALGGLMGMVAVMVHQPFLLVIAGGVFVMEALSVISQRYYFKYTRRRYGEGRRIFLMAPIHHHFEKLGWPETKIVTRFYILCILFGVFALVTLKIR
jgi:phospho-N-acetylmuramoyl-pentapeptide-transferase